MDALEDMLRVKIIKYTRECCDNMEDMRGVSYGLMVRLGNRCTMLTSARMAMDDENVRKLVVEASVTMEAVEGEKPIATGCIFKMPVSELAYHDGRVFLARSLAIMAYTIMHHPRVSGEWGDLLRDTTTHFSQFVFERQGKPGCTMENFWSLYCLTFRRRNGILAADLKEWFASRLQSSVDVDCSITGTRYVGFDYEPEYSGWITAKGAFCYDHCDFDWDYTSTLHGRIAFELRLHLMLKYLRETDFLF